MSSKTCVFSYIEIVYRQSLLTDLALSFFPICTERGVAVISDYTFQ